MVSTIKSLIATTKECSRTLGELIWVSSKASAQSTSTLMGVAGGFAGMAVAYGLSLIAPVSLAIAAPVFTGFGIVIAIIINRGDSRNDFERKLEQNRIASEEILRRINSLPRNVPQGTLDELWNTYNILNSIRSFPAQNNVAVPPPTAQNPILLSPNKSKVEIPVPSQKNDVPL